MLQYQELLPLSPRLLPYIESYFTISGAGKIPTKYIMPRPGTALTIDFTGKYYNGDNFLKMALCGPHEQPYLISSHTSQTDCIVIKFTSFGLSRFINIPLNTLVNQVVDATDIFDKEMTTLFSRLEDHSSPIQRIRLLENYLLQRLNEPVNTDISIFRMAGQIALQQENLSIPTLLEDIPLSIRQTERRFKQLIGTDLQTYLRVCRFNAAKKLLLHSTSRRLTDIAYNAQYYDQAHFSNEFKRLSGIRPGKYDACGESRHAAPHTKDVVLIQF
ncbi:helix-turn-helix protein [Chitinophaga niastensis]|uniref:Helix-turn-helix protein n=1 Tax=Chitinophaga niastensis TaxID=536980 RepID=A0A2P8HK22_CHINA|nr:helix-turn-helix domain-containing protein [Chitinophaga niastensis]PSL46567.1 helix-turn-helix protein [Chitinophaga niastensis]